MAAEDVGPAPAGIQESLSPVEHGRARDERIAGLLRDPRLWTGRKLAQAATHATGYATLDAQLPGGGWPRGGVVELLHDEPGIGELTLLAPALAQAGARGQGIALVGAPYRACAPAWAQLGIPLRQLLLVHAADARDRLWAAEQALRSGAFGAVLLWPRTIADRDLRRLQLAAEQGGALAFLFRPRAAVRQSSPAALRLRLTAPAPGAGLHVEILKSRGGSPRALQLELPGRTQRPRKAPHAVVVSVPAAPAARRAG